MGLSADADFSWLQTLTTLHNETLPAEITPTPRIAAFPDEKILDISDYRPSRQEANKLDLERRLAAGLPPDPIMPSPQVTDTAMDTPKNGLMGSLFPYIAAAFFFAIIGAGAIFYFVAIRLPERVQTVSGPSPYGDGTQSSDVLRDRGGRDLKQFSGEPKPDRQVRSASAARPLEIAAPIEAPASLPPAGLNVVSASTIVVDGGAPSNSFASAAIANLRPAVKAPAGGGSEVGDASPASLKPENDRQARGQGVNAVTPLEPAGSLAGDARQSRMAPSAPAPALEAPAAKPPVQASKPEEPKVDVSPATPAAQQPEAPVRSASLTPAEPPKSSQKPARVTKAISPDLENEYLARGRETLRDGDIAGARLLFQYLVDQGSAAGAYAMGQTYDPVMLASLGARGIKGNPKTARTWYEKAASMGNDEALAIVKGATR